MKYIKPHLSPELRAQITPGNRRDRRLTAAGVFFLVLSAVLAVNLVPKHNKSVSYNNRTVASISQSQKGPVIPEKQVLGASTEAQATAAPAALEQYTSYTVKNGDTLFNISQQYGIRWDLIAQINKLSEPYVLKPGQQLKIPQGTTSKLPGKVYTIKQNDTLATIAKQYNITVADIVAVNPNLQKSELITPGQIIKLP
ncbi:MAG: LysM peptidoglycan-binding domain-containing protein [Candidatus Saccharibacteria bacterium]